MNKFLSKYALFETTNNSQPVTDKVKKVLLNPLYHFIIFGIIMCVVGFLAKEKILPYSWQSALSTTFAYSIAAIGFCLLMGYSGLASLGTGGFIGIGSYSVYYVMQLAGLPFILAVLIAVAIAVVIGIIVGFISLRIEGIYLVILTLGLSEILRNLYRVIQDNIYLGKLTLFGQVIQRNEVIYLVMFFLVVIMILTHNIISSPTGRAMLAMKNSTAAAQAMGVNVIKYRLLAFVICTIYAALSGVLLMVTVRAAMASDSAGFYALITSLNILAAVIIGGFKSIWGAVFGCFVMYGMQTIVLNRITFLQENPVIITLISGILVILVVMFYPGGLAQLLTELKFKIKKLIKKIRENKYGKDIG